MNKIKLVSISVLSVFVFFTSCKKKKDDNQSSLQAENYHLTVKIDGDSRSFNEFVSVSAAADQSQFYQIQGVDDDGNQITFNLINPPSEGTYSPTAGDDITIFTYRQFSPLAIWMAAEDLGSGTVTITENNATYMEGTFLFTGVNAINTILTKEFTEGSFKAKKL